MKTISDSEFEVMKIIWSKPSVYANEIIDVLKETTDWTPQTIKTLINRLLKKEVIGYRKEGRQYAYFSLIDEDDYLKKESKSFIKKFYNNSISQVVNHFVEDRKVSKDEIDALRKLLDEVEVDE